jgi:hypothetical protein
LPSAFKPGLHSQELPVPKSPEKCTTDDDSNDDEPVSMEQNVSDPDFQPYASNERHVIFQGDFNDLVTDLNLSKSQDHKTDERRLHVDPTKHNLEAESIPP